MSGSHVSLPGCIGATSHPSSAHTQANISPTTPTWPPAYLVNSCSPRLPRPVPRGSPGSGTARSRHRQFEYCTSGPPGIGLRSSLGHREEGRDTIGWRKASWAMQFLTVVKSSTVALPSPRAGNYEPI
jgi:hypothetical protein